MKTEAKVVSLSVAQQLAGAGFSHETEWVWVMVDEQNHGLLVQSAKVSSMTRAQLQLYPAPDVSELLAALAYLGVVALHTEADQWSASLSYAAGGTVRGEGSTPQEALAQVWLEMRAETPTFITG